MHGLVNDSREIKIKLKSLSSVDPFLQKWHLKRGSSSLYPFSKKLENESLKQFQTIQFWRQLSITWIRPNDAPRTSREPITDEYFESDSLMSNELQFKLIILNFTVRKLFMVW